MLLIAYLNTPLVPNVTSPAYPLFKWLSVRFIVSGHVPLYEPPVLLIILNHIDPNSVRIFMLLKEHEQTSFYPKQNVKKCQEKNELQHEICYGFLTSAKLNHMKVTF